MKTPSKCPKCGAQMDEGFILEHRVPSRWVAGTPEKSLSGDVKAYGKEQRHIESYCCAECGYLELYARKRDRIAMNKCDASTVSDIDKTNVRR